MGLLIQLAQAATALNIVLLAALAAIWGRNYRRLRSKHALGLLVFSLLLLSQNGLSLYYYLWDPTLSDWFRDPELVPTVAMRGLMMLDMLQLAAVGFLVWVTVD
ncbi:hypothetical protein BRC81_03505 [Halobacteriales archaeon QS_1_68_20]|nr:MAG: hypothetical protein BRC81_03505 [Halobacteriales archaeon QS_1_68_20]